jgi:hypothetical protein
MLPEFPVSARRRKVGLIFGALVSCGFATYAVLTGPPPRVGPLVALACVVVGNAAVLFVGWPDTDGFLIRVRGERRVLRAVARLMPRAAGRRWLAEAESVLFEMPAARRGRAIRSYLCSAPRLAGMMWARRLRRRTGRRA